MSATLPILPASHRTALREAARDERAFRSLRHFVRRAWAIVEPRRPLVWGWHLDLICDALEASYRHETTSDVLVVNIPPRHSKSSIISVLGPAWWWLHHPEAQFLCITKAEKNATRDARHMRRVVTSPWYQRLLQWRARLGDGTAWTMSEDQDRVNYYANSEGGHRLSVTTNTDITGVGADFLIIDDPHDAEEVALGTPDRVHRMMDETESRYQEVWISRLNPGGRTQIVMQRLHENDLAGRRLRESTTTALVLPLEFEADHPYRHPLDPRRVEGERLCPARFDDDWVAKMKSHPAKWAGQAQQRPSPRGGGQIKREWLSRRYGCRPEDWASTADEVWVSADAAKKAGADADYHAIQVWARQGADRILLDRRHERMTYPDFQLAMDGMIALWRPRTRGLFGVLVEDTANGTTYLQCRAGHVDGLTPFHPSTDTPGADKSKPARAIYLERAAESGQVLLPSAEVAPWVEEWVHEVITFPGGAHDDDVDAASQLHMRWTTLAGWAEIGVSGP